MQYEQIPGDGRSDEDRNSPTKQMIGQRPEVLLSYKDKNGYGNIYYGVKIYAEVLTIVMYDVVGEIYTVKNLLTYRKASKMGNLDIFSQHIANKARLHRKKTKKVPDGSKKDIGNAESNSFSDGAERSSAVIDNSPDIIQGLNTWNMPINRHWCDDITAIIKGYQDHSLRDPYIGDHIRLTKAAERAGMEFTATDMDNELAAQDEMKPFSHLEIVKVVF